MEAMKTIFDGNDIAGLIRQIKIRDEILKIAIDALSWAAKTSFDTRPKDFIYDAQRALDEINKIKKSE